MFGNELDRQLFKMLAVVVASTVAATLLLVWLLPKFWEAFKPWLHAVTA